MKLLPIEGCGACTNLAHAISYTIPQATTTALGASVKDVTYNCPLIERRIVDTTTIHKDCPLCSPDEIDKLLSRVLDYAYKLGQHYPSEKGSYKADELRILMNTIGDRLRKRLEGERV